jgi:hypothetical protein
MKQYAILAAVFLLFSAPLLAQSAGLLDFNTERLQRTRNSMLILGTWATANIAVGAVGMTRAQGSDKAFHQMNLGWGLVNAGLAASGLWTASHTDPASFDLYQSTLEHHRLQKIFLFNAGLDAGYMMGGLWMVEKSKTALKHQDRLRGFGKSILLQGAFLFVFDIGAAIYHQRLEQRLPAFFEQTSLHFDGRSAGLYLRL